MTKKLKRKEMFETIGKVVKAYLQEDIEIVDKNTGEVMPNVIITFKRGGKGLFPRLDKAFKG